MKLPLEELEAMILFLYEKNPQTQISFKILKEELTERNITNDDSDIKLLHSQRFESYDNNEVVVEDDDSEYLQSLEARNFDYSEKHNSHKIAQLYNDYEMFSFFGLGNIN